MTEHHNSNSRPWATRCHGTQRDCDEDERRVRKRPRHPFSRCSLEELRQAQEMFAIEREWEVFHTPRNLLLALVGEVGEVSEIFQWRADDAAGPGLPSFSTADRIHLGEELADVLLYLVRLADVCGVDLAQAAVDKIAKNAAKYPADRCRGSAAKYTAYAATTAARPASGGSGSGTEGGAVPEDGTATGGTRGDSADVSGTLHLGIVGTTTAAAKAATKGGRGSQSPPSLSLTAGAPSSCTHTTATGTVATGTAGGGSAAPGSPDDDNSDAGKRKRFTDEQVEELTALAESVSWSMQEVTREKRDAVCKRLGITRERMSNFFNNRKPKDLKKARRTDSLFEMTAAAAAGVQRPPPISLYASGPFHDAGNRHVKQPGQSAFAAVGPTERRMSQQLPLQHLQQHPHPQHHMGPVGVPNPCLGRALGPGAPSAGVHSHPHAAVSPQLHHQHHPHHPQQLSAVHGTLQNVLGANPELASQLLAAVSNLISSKQRQGGEIMRSSSVPVPNEQQEERGADDSSGRQPSA